MSTLRIGKPSITISDKRAKLSANISNNENGTNFDLWYDVDKTYAEYLCSETSDAFLVAMLPYAMEHQLDIICDDTISEKLYFNLQQNLIPILSKYSKIFKRIKIIAEKRTNKRFTTATANATGLSCGVDSFDTIKDMLYNTSKSYELSALTFFNVGSHRSTSGLDNTQSLQLYTKRLENSARIAKLLNLPLIDINSNLGEHLTQPFVKVHHYCSFSAVLALQKLFGNYFYSSAYPVSYFSIKKCDVGAAYYEPLTAKYLCTETTEFHISGLNKTRIDKIKNISDFPIANDNLNVCFKSDTNCGSCEKCIRTQLELYSCGKLELFKNSFDIDKFNKNFDKYMKYALKHQNQSAYAEILKEMKNNNINLNIHQHLQHCLYFHAILFLKK